MRGLGFLTGVFVGWLGARLGGDQAKVAQQAEMQGMQRTLDACRQTLADRSAEIERLRAELERLQGELSALRAAPPSVSDVTPGAEKLAPLPVAAPDDLSIIEGIGPKIAALLAENGICTFTDLAAADPSRLRDILSAAGPRFRLANPATWPQQADLAARGAWDDLAALQARLKAGIES